MSFEHPLRIDARMTDLGDGMQVHRTLPSRLQRTVGAWCFLDHVGPVDMAHHTGMHVGQHPHIGLQTFTWMLSGEIWHRDSLGTEQLIRPGQINLMTAGRGIVHTEDSQATADSLHLAQLWIALPAHLQDMEPHFAHYPHLPQWEEQGAQYTLLVGQYASYQAPTQVYSPLLGLDIAVEHAQTLHLVVQPGFEYALQTLVGGFVLTSAQDAQRYDTSALAYWPADAASSLVLDVEAGSRLLLLGGEPLSQKPTMWWNFVAYEKERIAQAQQDWQAASPRFGVVGDGKATRIAAPAIPWR
ncbi:pirin family protein [Curvibacter sp. CHRR-16]|uniref:pirin family protein n=1 Tax=Curvibacter sp. CHRR-16 TaxID=2835872 RepID=UPI001BD9ABD0|nr:pirin family protein [Curvibacter sp. CHRR-16]MBT0571809.1 pirin family protein [Curvibacter sp. CHRR-16]